MADGRAFDHVFLIDLDAQARPVGDLHEALVIVEHARIAHIIEQDYGWLVMMHKIDHNEVVWVDVQPDADGNAVLPPDLASAVTDLADRKMVAAALAALELGSACKLTNASDTDWLDCQKALRVVGLEVENLLNDWLVARWHTKHGKRARYD